MEIFEGVLKEPNETAGEKASHEPTTEAAAAQ